MGGHITWQSLGGDQYVVTLTKYIDCFGVGTTPTTETVTFFPSGCAGIPFSADLAFQSENEVSELCPTELVNSSCSGGLIPGVIKQVYNTTVTLPAGCTWKMIWNGYGWNYFNNIDFSTLPDAYISATLLVANTSSPVINTAIPVSYECRNTGSITNNVSVSIPAGFTATYTAVTPQTTGAGINTSINTPGYSNIGGLSVNSSTGAITFQSNGLQIGNYLTTIQIDIFQGATQVGTMFENVAIIIRDCTNTPTVFNPDGIIAVTSSTGSAASLTSIDVCAGDSICFTVSAENSNIFRTVILSETHPAILNPGNPTIVMDTSALNPRLGTFCMATNSSMIGTHVVQLRAEDDACVAPSIDNLNITINIYPSVQLSIADTTICFGQSLTVTASGAPTYSWTVLSGDPTPGFDGSAATQVLESIGSNTVIEVSVPGVPAFCNARDTLTVDVSLSTLTLNATAESCLQNDGAVSTTVAGGSGNYSYLWSPGNQNTPNIANLIGGNYSVTVSDVGLAGCSRTASTTVNTTPPPGGSFAIGGSSTICAGSSGQLIFTLTGTGPWTINGTGAGVPWPLTANTSPFTINATPATTTTYTLTSISYSATPACVTNIGATQTMTVRPLVSGNFSAAGPICSGASLPLTLNLNQPGSYDVTYTSVPVDPASAPNPQAGPFSTGAVLNAFNPSANTTYTVTNVQYTTVPNCPNPQNNAINVVVNPLPTATLTGGGNICAGSSATLTLNLTGTGPWTGAGTINGIIPVPINTNLASSTITATPPVSGNVCINTISDANGCSSNGLNVCQPITVTPLSTPSITISSDLGTTICAGSTVTFTAVYANGGLTPAFQWRKNGNPVGAGLSTFTTSILSNNDVITCTLIPSAEACASPTTATSNTLTLTVNPVVTPSVTIIAAPAGPICQGTSVTFTATPINGGAAPTFVWKKNGVIVGSGGLTYTDATLANGDIVLVEMTSNAPCPNPAIVASTGITMSVNPLVVPSVSISSSPTSPICQGASVTFTATVTNGGSNPVLQWRKNGNPVGTNATTYSDAAIVNGDVITIQLTSNATCASPAVITGNTLNLTVIPNVTPSVNITVSPAFPVCAGTLVTFTATPTNGGTAPIYQWKKNGVNVGSGGATYSNAGLFNGETVSVEMTSNASCATPILATSNSITTIINPLLNPSVSIVANPISPICSGTSTTFTATPTNGGVVPTYQWFVNGTPQPGNTAVFTITTLTNPSSVNVIMTSNEQCLSQPTATSNAINMVVNPLVTPSVTIAAVPAGPVCAGTSVTFTATPVNGGNSPSYQWYLNGNPVGTNSATYTNNTLNNGDQINVVMTSSDPCSNPTIAASNVIDVQTNPVVTPTISITGSPGNISCSNAAVTFNAVITNGGSAPVYQWLVNGSPVGGNSPSFTISSLNNNDQISCGLLSNFTCAQPANVVSNVITQTVNALPTATLSGNAVTCAGTAYAFTVSLTGTGPYTFGLFNGGSLVQTYNNVNGPSTAVSALTPGTYTIQNLSDSNCPSPAVSNGSVLTLNALPTASWAIEDTSFCSGSSINLIATLGGAAPYNVVVNNGAAVSVAGTLYSSSVSTGGVYTINQITDANGCVSASNDQIQVTEIPLPIANAGANQTVCSGIPFTLGSPAIGTQTYSWNNSTYLTSSSTSAQPTAAINNPGPGQSTITFTVTASIAQCSSTDDVVVTVNPLPTISVTALTDSLCLGSSTTITASGASTYVWAGSPSITSPLNAASITVNPNTTSSYTVSATDNNQCSNSGSITIVVGTALQVQQNFTSQVCFGACNGSINLTPSGSFPPYNVSWLAPNANLSGWNPTNLCAGTYGYVVTDNQGCTTAAQNLSVQINQLPQNFFDQIIVTQPVCFGDVSGSISLIEQGTNYTLYSEPGHLLLQTGISGDFVSLAAGQYSVSVNDINGCPIDSGGINLQSLSSAMSISSLPMNSVYCFQETATFEAQALGGAGQLTYHWSNCQNAPSCILSDSNPFNFVLTSDTTLYVYATDIYQCSTAIIPVTANVSPAIVLSTAGNQTICQGICYDLSAGTSYAGGNGNVVVQWYELPGGIGGTSLPPNVCPVFTTSYIALASDGCSVPDNATVTITVNPTPEALFSVDTLAGCSPLPVQFVNLTDPTFINQCVWTLGDGSVLATCDTLNYTYQQFGNYNPSLTVTTPQGCTNTTTLAQAITVRGFPEINFTWTPDPVTVLEHDVQFINRTQAAASYNWSFGVIGQSTLPNPSFDFPNVDNGEYPICLIATSIYGCKDTLCKTLIVNSILQVFVPNAFTPDQDDVNEVWLPSIKGADPSSYHLWIYDRWGNKMFETTDPAVGWTGSVAGGAYYPQNDVYVWRMEMKARNDYEIKVFEGTVTLIR